MKNQIVVAIKNQFAVVLIVGGGIIIAPAVFIVAHLPASMHPGR
ncbi:MAG: hypothetical protein WBG13_27930 [Pseudolabrys sp.]